MQRGAHAKMVVAHSFRKRPWISSRWMSWIHGVYTKTASPNSSFDHTYDKTLLIDCLIFFSLIEFGVCSEFKILRTLNIWHTETPNLFLLKTRISNFFMKKLVLTHSYALRFILLMWLWLIVFAKKNISTSTKLILLKLWNYGLFNGRQFIARKEMRYIQTSHTSIQSTYII